jgi:threonine dehydrogenase-like Zn-dependent dehydrogenase
MCCRKAGTVSIPGVYVGMGDKIPLGERHRHCGGG